MFGTTSCDAAWMVPDASGWWEKSAKGYRPHSRARRPAQQNRQSGASTRRGSVEGRRSSVVGESRQWEQHIGQHPDVILSKARARVAKLEVAMNAVGEDDPTYAALRDSLKQARVQAQLRPVEDRIKATTSFIERAKRRIGEHQANILRLEEQLAEAKSEEQEARQHLHDGEERLCKLRQEASRMAEDIPPTAPADFIELAQLRSSVQELQRERDELRAQLSSNARSEERERKQPRNLSSSTLELAPLSRGATGQNEFSGQVHRGVGGDSSALMETLIDNAESNFRSANRFNPLLST